MRTAALFVSIALLASAGCKGSDGRVVVKGSLTDGGKPFVLDTSKLKLPGGATAAPPGSDPLQVVFIAAEGGEQFPAQVEQQTATFTVSGPDGKGIKPGKYKIAVTASLGAADYFGGKFSEEKTQIAKDVVAGQEVVIDVSKPQG